MIVDNLHKHWKFVWVADKPNKMYDQYEIWGVLYRHTTDYFDIHDYKRFGIKKEAKAWIKQVKFSITGREEPGFWRRVYNRIVRPR